MKDEDNDIIIEELEEKPKSKTSKEDTDLAIDKLFNSLNLPKEMEELV